MNSANQTNPSNHKRQGKVSSSFLSAALLVGLSTGLQGCTEDEVAVGVGLIAIGAGAAIIGGAIGDGDHHDRRDGRYRCEGGYSYRCTTYRDYYGNTHRECRDVYDSCKYRRWSPYTASPLALAVTNVETSSAEKVEVESEKWASTFGMSFESAEFFTKALEKARDGNIKGLYDLGLSRSDVLALSKEKMPSSEGIDLLARKLNQSEIDTKVMLEKLLKKGSELKKKECRRSVHPGRGGRLALCK